MNTLIQPNEAIATPRVISSLEELAKAIDKAPWEMAKDVLKKVGVEWQLVSVNGHRNPKCSKKIKKDRLSIRLSDVSIAELNKHFPEDVARGIALGMLYEGIPFIRIVTGVIRL